MRLSRALEDKKMDLRLRDKLVHEGKLTGKAVEDYLKSLPDDRDKVVFSREDDFEEDEGEREETA